MKKYLTAFLGGLAAGFLIAFVFALKRINVISADTVIQSLEQTIKKLKQDGQGNISDMSSTVGAQGTEEKTKKQTRKEKRELKKAQNKS